MVVDFLKKSKVHLLILVLLGLVFFVISLCFKDFIVKIDNWFIEIINNIVNERLTVLMKIVTNFGGVLVFLAVLVVLFLLVSDKKVGILMSTNLLIAYAFSVIFKNIFRRERPLFMLIEKPFDFSFPSGHTMCSVAFYGFLIYVVNRKVSNVNIRRVINIFLVMIMILVPFSRLYLGVHFFTDVLAGLVLGLVCLICFVNYVKIKELL